MVRGLVALVALGGCGRWGFGSSNPDSATADDAIIDALVTSGCIAPAPADADAFPGTNAACAPWGALIMDFTNVVESAGGLEITSHAGHLGAQGGCIHASAPFDAGGAFVELGNVPPSATSALTGFVIDELGGGGGKFAMYAEAGLLKARDYTTVLLSVPHDPVAMRWLRIRPSSGVEFEASPDGRAWTSIGASPKAPPAMVQVTIYAGVSAAEPAPLTARFEGVNVCP
jgi:hypothetical protein